MPTTRHGPSCSTISASARSDYGPGQPNGEPAWRWNCGFYPGLEPGQHMDGVAASFDEARDEFQKALEHIQTVMRAYAFERHREWQAADAIRQQRIKDGWTPPSWEGWMTCVCGVRFNSWDPVQNQEHAPHIYAARDETGPVIRQITTA